MAREYEKRRTFAIISHPDAGKTTLTEKLLLYGGAIHMAGAVKSRKAKRAATSDWMEIEKKRGISVTSSVLAFEFEGIHYNLLDTPGHQDFSEDTYRTLTAADCAIMLIDAAKGVEPQTRKLFHVCRMRGTPIVTFVNKLDRPARDPFELMSEVEEVLGLHTVPFTWPIGDGDRFQGVYVRGDQACSASRSTEKNATKAPVQVGGIEDPELQTLIGEQPFAELHDAIELLDGAGEEFSAESFLSGEQTPVFFGSALTNFGVEPFLRDFREHLPVARPARDARDDEVRARRRPLQRLHLQGAGEHGPVAPRPHRLHAHLLRQVRGRDAGASLPPRQGDPPRPGRAVLRRRARVHRARPTPATSSASTTPASTGSATPSRPARR